MLKQLPISFRRRRATVAAVAASLAFALAASFAGGAALGVAVGQDKAAREGSGPQQLAMRCEMRHGGCI